MNENVVIGFGNSAGRMSLELLKEKYHIIERLNIKASVKPPEIGLKNFADIDLGIYKGLISKRRNQMLLQSFIGLDEGEGGNDNFEKLKYDAIQQIENINEELNTTIFYLKCNKFIQSTNSTEQLAEDYLREFNGNLEEAIKVYNQRSAIIRSFAEKHKMNILEASRILKENNYNAQIFD